MNQDIETGIKSLLTILVIELFLAVLIGLAAVAIVYLMYMACQKWWNEKKKKRRGEEDNMTRSGDIVDIYNLTVLTTESESGWFFIKVLINRLFIKDKVIYQYSNKNQVLHVQLPNSLIDDNSGTIFS